MPVKKYFTSEERKEGRRLSRIRYYSNHPEKVLAQNLKWRQDNRESIRVQHRDIARTTAAKFSTLKARGRKKNIEVALTFEQFEILNSLPCDYCGEPLPEVGYGIDRKDNLLGYIPENSVPCCYRCNTMKGSYLTYDEMKLIWQRRNRR